MTALALWLASSVLAGLLAGRFIRTGMVDQVQEAQP
jgi:hypothetical protein